MEPLQYYAGGMLRTIRIREMFTSLSDAKAPGRRSRRYARGFVRKPLMARGEIAATLKSQEKRLATRFHSLSESKIPRVLDLPVTATIIPTESVAIDQARSSELGWMRNRYGMQIVKEGRHGKVLLQAPSDADDPVGMAFEAARLLYERGRVGGAHPNFLRMIQRPAPSSRPAVIQWALDNQGKPGLIGADVHALAAWTITKGSSEIRVAVLDEGIDTKHPYLRSAVVEEVDFVDGNAHARPDGDDAHGTACAGIIVSQAPNVCGLAPGLGLIAVRIAESDAWGFWIFDDFDTADAIDWAWDTARADVLSNSWGGGPPADVITRAFERARELGRGRKGSVVVAAAGNEQGPVSFPATLEGVLTVGASNQWDERKTKTSRDGETWWGSNYGNSLDLLAPGVRILTTDIEGSHGYTDGDVTPTFNGTSAATPFAAAVAALILSVNPKLTEDRVREIINSTADPINGSGKRDRYVGHGRLNAYAALRLARRG